MPTWQCGGCETVYVRRVPPRLCKLCARPEGWISVPLPDWHPRKRRRKARKNKGVKVPARKRQKIYARDGWRCLRCRAAEPLTLDHIKPHSQGGTGNYNNLQTLCVDCNQWKGNRHIDFRKSTRLSVKHVAE